jgi:hypothetical protein
MPIELRCIEKKHKNELWELRLGREKVWVTNAAGEVVGEFEPDDVSRYFQLPSFSESIKYFGILLGERWWRFNVDRDGLRRIRNYINRTIVAAGPEAVQAVRNRALRDLVVGVLLAVAGVVITVVTYSIAANKPGGGKYYITYGLVIVGLVMAGKGTYGFSQYSSLKRMAAAQDEQDDRPPPDR